MAETPMIERLARAWIDDEGLDWDILPDSDKAKLCRHARAVLAELENPSEAMLIAARDWYYRKYAVGNDGATGCFRAMIRAAAKGGE